MKVSWRFANLFLDGGDVKEPLPYLCISYLSSFTFVIVIPKILLTLLCRKNPSLERRDVRRAQILLPQRSRLHGIDAKIR